MPPSPDDVVGQTFEGTPVTRAEIEAAAEEMRGWLQLKTTTGACSASLVHQLAGHYCRIPESFGSRPLLVDVHAVLDKIGELEKAPLTRSVPTKPASMFRAGALKGLWHVHWFQASELVTNLRNETDRHGEQFIHRFLTEEFGRGGWVGEQMTEELASRLVHAAVEGAFVHRSGGAKRKQSRLTGEWIVFAKMNGRNIYLTLAGHGETDEAVFTRCSKAREEFPELAIFATPCDRSV